MNIKSSVSSQVKHQPVAPTTQAALPESTAQTEATTKPFNADAFIQGGAALAVGSAVGTLANPMAALAFAEQAPAHLPAAEKALAFARFVALPGAVGTATSLLSSSLTGHENLKADFLIGAGSGAVANTALLGKNVVAVALGATAGGLGAISAHAIRHDKSMRATAEELFLGTESTGSSPAPQNKETNTLSNLSRGLASGVVLGTVYGNIRPLSQAALGKGQLTQLLSHNKKIALSTLAPAAVGALASETLAHNPEAGAGFGFMTGMFTGAMVNFHRSKADMIMGITLGALTGAAAGYTTQK